MNLKEIKLDTYKKFNEKDMGDFTIECMRKAVRQALELAAKRAEVKDTPDGSDVGHEVNKQSILDVMEDID